MGAGDVEHIGERQAGGVSPDEDLRAPGEDQRGHGAKKVGSGRESEPRPSDWRCGKGRCQLKTTVSRLADPHKRDEEANGGTDVG